MNRLKVLSVVGARPQFVEAFPISDALRRDRDEMFIHTSRHYDESMSGTFFDGLAIPEPDYSLGVGSSGRAAQTAETMTQLNDVVADKAPDVVLVYGDTNSTLVAVLVAAKRDPVLTHIEASLRSHNWAMPERINRVLTDHCSDLLSAPSESAAETLAAKGIRNDVSVTGDVQYDAVLRIREAARERSSILDDFDLRGGEYVLATVRRAANTGDRDRLEGIAEGLTSSELPVVFPIHPRTEGALEASGLWSRLADIENVILAEPVGYLDFVRLLDGAGRVAADSGDIQKEAFYPGTRCLTLRDEIEWAEIIDAGWNILVGVDAAMIRAALIDGDPLPEKPSLYSDGSAAERIVVASSEYEDA